KDDCKKRPADYTRCRPVTHRVQYSRARSFRFPIDRIGVSCESNPQPVEHPVDQTDNQTIDDMADQRSEERPTPLIGPIERVSLPLGQDRQRSEEPPEQAVGCAPTHTRSIAAHVSLKQKAESDTDDYRKNEVQRDAYHHRFRIHQPCDPREKIDRSHPCAKGPAADNACKTADQNRSSKAERRQPRLCPEPRVKSSQHPNRQPERRSKAKDVSDKFW